MLTLRENMQLVLQHKEPQYMPLMSDFDTANPETMDFVNERPPIPGTNLDWFGQSWTYEPMIGAANPTPGVHLVTDITRWREQMEIPDVDRLDWELRARQDTAHWQRDQKMSRLNLTFGLWERMFSVMDFEEALCALLLEPESCYDFFGAIADYKIKLYQKMIDHYQPDIICMHDDYGDSRNLFMPPEVWRDLIKPHLKRVIDSIQSRGCIYEHHNCGHFLPIMDDMLELGIEITNSVHISNNIRYLKEKYGTRMVFVGGFDVQYICSPMATEEGIRQNVRETMDILAPGGGFIPLLARSKPGMEEVIAYAKNFYGPRPC